MVINFQETYELDGDCLCGYFLEPPSALAIEFWRYGREQGSVLFGPRYQIQCERSGMCVRTHGS